MLKRILHGGLLLCLSTPLTAAEENKPSEAKEAGSLSTRHITVVTMFKQNDSKPEEGLVFAGCREWQLSDAGVVAYFSHAEEIAPEETHSYPWFACRYAGTLLMNGTPFKFEINAGLTGQLENQATTERKLVHYGCKNACSSLTPFGDTYEYVD